MKANTTVVDSTAIWTRRWARNSRNVAKARAELGAVLGEWGLQALADPALVVLSELITNAVRHARTASGREIETRCRREADGVRIEVHDADEQRPRHREPGETGGYGLVLVEALSVTWGVDDRDGVGKVVWALVVPRGDNGAPREGR
ncbi:ATP-binding protein [Streptomyces qinzhouensis]|uniref:ATP-binding protein n=2 Tax=Streptomyces qinzhouensis TaxID=2599401 RepID=A0A5B8IGI3_9ACTN|nr:ATP-binding protein [Streptomyces qinzhouensis]